jgi:hypothetical protein
MFYYLDYPTSIIEEHPRLNPFKKKTLENILLVNDWPLCIHTFILTMHFIFIFPSSFAISLGQ